jgi:uncharacterized protein (DUF1697 family)
MARHIAFLRAINVGGNRLVPMAQLRTLLEAQGYTEVVTLLQSGNVVFTSPRGAPAEIARKIERAIQEEFGFEVGVVIRSRTELGTILGANPFPGAEEVPAKLQVMLFAQPPNAERLALLKPAAYRPDEFKVVGRDIYLRLPNGAGRSKLIAALGDPRLGGNPTARNWNTLKKLLALA